MPTLPARVLQLSSLAVSSLMLLSACGGGGDSRPDQVATNPPPVQPSPPTNPPPATPPADPPPPVQPEPPATPPQPSVVLADSYTDLVAGTINSQPGWSAWTGGTGREIGGVGCLVNEDYHIHALVTIYRDGVRMGLPDNIGRSGCAYELHTHDVTGVVHIETDVPKKFTLGQFFTLWGQPLATAATAGLPGPIRYYLIENEKLTPFTGDPAQLELKAHREIVIVSGSVSLVLPRYRWPAGI